MKTLHIPEQGDKLLYDGQEYVIERVDDIADYYNGDEYANYEVTFKSTHGEGKASLDDIAWNGEVFVASDARLPILGPAPPTRDMTAYEKMMYAPVFEQIENEAKFLDMFRSNYSTWHSNLVPLHISNHKRVDQIEVEGEG